MKNIMVYGFEEFISLLKLFVFFFLSAIHEMMITVTE